MLTQRVALSLCVFLACLILAASLEEGKEKKCAIVTLLTTKSYVPGALVLAESLDQVEAKGDRILMWVGPEDDERSDVGEEDIERLKPYYDKIIQLSKADGSYTECLVSEQHKQVMANDPHWSGLQRYWGTCSKFAIWNLIEYDIVVYMDADSIALNNFDFVFDFLDDDDDDEESDNEPKERKQKYSFAAHPVPECYDKGECDNFYSAFMVLKPMPNIQNYLHSLAGRQYLADGEITLLNQVIQHWKHLPRYTLIAQTETPRPTDPETGRPEWTSGTAKVYDFAGTPKTKPWVSHKISRQLSNPNFHSHFGNMRPGTLAHDRYMIPQMIWNEHYDRILEREKRSEQENGSEVGAIDKEL